MRHALPRVRVQQRPAALVYPNRVRIVRTEAAEARKAVPEVRELVRDQGPPDEVNLSLHEGATRVIRLRRVVRVEGERIWPPVRSRVHEQPSLQLFPFL